MGNAILVRKGGIDVSAATAMPEMVFSGASFFAGENDDLQEGTMPNRGAVYKVLNEGETYIVPKGYHDGHGRVRATSLLSQTQATATPTQILSGQTAYVNGEKITGTMPNRGANNIVLPVNGTATIPEGYHNGQGRVSQNLVTQGGYTNPISSWGTNPAFIRIPQGYYGTNTVSGYPEIVYSLDMARSSGYALQSEVDHWRNSYYGMEQDRNNWINVANSRPNVISHTITPSRTYSALVEYTVPFYFRDYNVLLIDFEKVTRSGYTNYWSSVILFKSNQGVFNTAFESTGYIYAEKSKILDTLDYSSTLKLELLTRWDTNRSYATSLEAYFYANKIGVFNKNDDFLISMRIRALNI